MSDTATCIKCAKEMPNFEIEGLQPGAGLAFCTYGHYGSSFFDPMDGSYLEIAVCDACVKQAYDAGLIYHGKPRERLAR